MFITVKLLNGFQKSLTYNVPQEWDDSLLKKGTIVVVPLRNKKVHAAIIATHETIQKTTYAIKDALALESLPCDPHYLSFIEKLAWYYQIEPLYFLSRIKQFLEQAPETAPSTHSFSTASSALNTLPDSIILTEEQSNVVSFLSPRIAQSIFTPIVLHGVTGSGKTEVYKKSIAHAFDAGKTTILLFPEVSLALQFQQILRLTLPQTITIIGFHSATSNSDKKKLWEMISLGIPLLIIGVHLPILLPISNLGLIIVDEEHECGYQEKKHPKINTKEAALWRASLCSIPIVLGSATPSITTLYNAQEKKWPLFQLKNRFSGSFPSLTFVSLNDKKERYNFWISNELLQALKKQLEKKEQSLIFLNRRGMSFFVQCKTCAFVFACSSCSVSLTLHNDNTMRCHYCGHKEIRPNICTACNNATLLNKGIGTQQIVSLLQTLLPHARIDRADLDATSNKKKWQKTIASFHDQQIDILVGTQTITKGYHFPNVTLVGIIWGDCNLHFPFYNAQETTLQQLIQVAGRAGRQSPTSLVIIQSMGSYPLFDFIDETRYLDFYTQEIKQRMAAKYPPINRLAEIELKHTDESIIEKEALHVAHHCMQQKDITTLGPTQPLIAKIKNTFSRKIYLKASSFDALIATYETLDKNSFESSLFFTPNPMQ